MLPRVIGHQGAAAYAPENTLEGLREAHRRGARAVEFDAKLTGDGAVILMHDNTLDRTTSGHGPVAAATFEQIQRLDAGGWFGPTWRDARVPTLRQTLNLLVELDMQANVEIKTCPGRDEATALAVVAEVRASWPAGWDWPVLSSFSRQCLAVAQSAAPELPRGLLVWRQPADWAEEARALGCVNLHCAHQNLTQSWAAEIRGLGYCLIVYTLNDAARARELFTWGVQGVITDQPDLILAAV
ncbi:MAG: glycerophosphodiester phosphodiesterase [Dongiaceae bacterium]